MFGSNEKNVGKKSFQKPNILRRKGKASVSKASITSNNESPEAISLVTIPPMETIRITNQLDNITQLEGSSKSTNVAETIWGIAIAKNCENKQNNILKSQETDVHANFNSNTSVTEIKSEGLQQNLFNIEYFMNNADSTEQDLPIEYDATVLTEKKTTQAKPKWCFDITNNSMDIIINNHKEHQLGNLEEKLDSVIIVPSEPVSEQQPEQVHNQVATVTTPTQSIAVNYSNRAVKFKCDQPNCNKGFWSEEKLKKHKNSHKRQAYRTPTQITYECPVKKKAIDGSEEKCPRTFEVRGDLLKHLDEDHTLDEAQHRCDVCGRRFFWAMGLRAHATSLCARGGLACAWPGCGRVFRLPCRLREHARAHTGDRPYLCRYPDCGWAFRSASKLVRHARRHTDERRHACATCGRAFLRREHLRDHAARHHRAARAAHGCAHAGCEQTFTNMSTLYMHMKKVHRKGKGVAVASVAEDPPANASEDGDYNVYFVSVPDNVVIEEEESKAVSAESAEDAENADAADEDVVEEDAADGHAAVEDVADEDVADEDAVAEDVAEEDVAVWHAARTHCTWPLPRAAHAHYVLDDDVHVELAEGSVSDVYTVRSDLFLHGNVPIDDDSQQIVGAALGGEAGAMDADLCLIDAHPTIDLMQEELMYEDAADESSFRVFLMNGEELT